MLQFNDKILEQLNPNEFWVLSHLLKRCDNKMECFPSIETLQNDCDMGRETIQNSLKNLAKKEIIVKIQRHKNGKLSSNIYRIVTKLASKNNRKITENQCTENQCTENQCTENQCTENQCTENQCTENQCTEKPTIKVLENTLESINHFYESINQVVDFENSKKNTATNFQNFENKFTEISNRQNLGIGIKKTAENLEEERILKNKKFASDLYTDTTVEKYAVENIRMGRQEFNDSILENIRKFENQLELDGKTHFKYVDFRTHFTNWLRQQFLNNQKNKKNETANNNNNGRQGHTYDREQAGYVVGGLRKMREDFHARGGFGENLG